MWGGIMVHKARDIRGFEMLDPERPIAEIGPVQKIFANGVCGVELIGSGEGTLRITFYQDGRTRLDGQPVEKIPEFELLMSLPDAIGARQEVSRRLKALGIHGFDAKPS